MQSCNGNDNVLEIKDVCNLVGRAFTSKPCPPANPLILQAKTLQLCDAARYMQVLRPLQASVSKGAPLLFLPHPLPVLWAHLNFSLRAPQHLVTVMVKPLKHRSSNPGIMQYLVS